MRPKASIGPGVTGVETLSLRSGSLRGGKVAVRLTLLAALLISIRALTAGGCLRAASRGSGLGCIHQRARDSLVGCVRARRLFGKPHIEIQIAIEAELERSRGESRGEQLELVLRGVSRVLALVGTAAELAAIQEQAR